MSSEEYGATIAQAKLTFEGPRVPMAAAALAFRYRCAGVELKAWPVPGKENVYESQFQWTGYRWINEEEKPSETMNRFAEECRKLEGILSVEVTEPVLMSDEKSFD